MPIIKKNENLSDFVIREAGSTEALFFIAMGNGVSITEDVLPGAVLNYDIEALNMILVPAKKKAVSVPAYVPLPKKVLRKHQTNFDFVCQHAGTMEYLFEMAKLNGLSITKTPTPGSVLECEVADEKTVIAFDGTGYTIASGDNVLDDIRLPGGIGYMKIESTFIVS